MEEIFSPSATSVRHMTYSRRLNTSKEFTDIK